MTRPITQTIAEGFGMRLIPQKPRYTLLANGHRFSIIKEIGDRQYSANVTYTRRVDAEKMQTQLEAAMPDVVFEIIEE